jgi:hypothetical protein
MQTFGGVGSQCAVVWRDGAVVLGPLKTTDEDGNMTPLLEGAINRALRALGVQRGSVRDEFEALGLGWHRDNEDWVATLSSEPARHTGAARRR